MTPPMMAIVRYETVNHSMRSSRDLWGFLSAVISQATDLASPSGRGRSPQNPLAKAT